MASWWRKRRMMSKVLLVSCVVAALAIAGILALAAWASRRCRTGPEYPSECEDLGLGVALLIFQVLWLLGIVLVTWAIAGVVGRIRRGGPPDPDQPGVRPGSWLYVLGILAAITLVASFTADWSTPDCPVGYQAYQRTNDGQSTYLCTSELGTSPDIPIRGMDQHLPARITVTLALASLTAGLVLGGRARRRTLAGRATLESA